MTGTPAGILRSAPFRRILIVALALAALAVPRALPSQQAASPEPEASGSNQLEDPNRTRLFFGPTGRTLAGGDGYAGLYELFFPFVSYGITDWVTISGGTPIIPGAMGEIFYLAPAVRVASSPNYELSAGVLALFSSYDDFDEGSVGIVYGVGTAGDEDQSITTGVGWGFMGTEMSNTAIFMLGGESRIGARSKLITENYFSSAFDGAAFSAGVRLFGENISGDVGLAGLIGDGTTCCIPLLNFVYHFGNGR